LFNLHQQTEGKAGINPDLTKPSIILEQDYHQHEFLHTLNKSYIANRFRSLANKWKLNKALTTGRKRKFHYFLIYFIIYFCDLKTDTTTAVFYLGTTAMGSSGSFYCSGHRRISAKKEEIRRKSRTHQELSRKKEKRKGKRNKKKLKKKLKNLPLTAAMALNCTIQ
jgi:hypothetical protein